MRARRIYGLRVFHLLRLDNHRMEAKIPLFAVQHMCLVQKFCLFWAISPYKALDVLF
jgi:hypothetical protein